MKVMGFCNLMIANFRLTLSLLSYSPHLPAENPKAEEAS